MFMRNKLHIFTFFATIILPVFTIVNLFFYYFDIDYGVYFSVININMNGIFIILLKEAKLFWKIISLLLIFLTNIMFVVLPIMSFIKKQETLYVIQFSVIFLDIFLVCGLPNSYFVLILNFLYHIFLLFLLGNMIKQSDE